MQDRRCTPSRSIRLYHCAITRQSPLLTTICVKYWWQKRRRVRPKQPSLVENVREQLHRSLSELNINSRLSRKITLVSSISREVQCFDQNTNRPTTRSSELIWHLSKKLFLGCDVRFAARSAAIKSPLSVGLSRCSLSRVL